VKVQATPGTEQLFHPGRPPADALEPAQGAEAHVDDVEPVGREDRSGSEDVPLHEPDPVGEPGSLGQRTGLGDRRSQEVEARHDRARVGEGQRVEVEVALEVDDVGTWAQMLPEPPGTPQSRAPPAPDPP
jgi:hypothetical protein